MSEDTPRQRLAKLHAELHSAHQADPAAHQQLGELMPHIQQLADGGALDPGASAALPGRLQQVAVKFETEHPKLAGSVRSLVDLLAEVGI